MYVKVVFVRDISLTCLDGGDCVLKVIVRNRVNGECRFGDYRFNEEIEVTALPIVVHKTFVNFCRIYIEIHYGI